MPFTPAGMAMKGLVSQLSTVWSKVIPQRENADMESICPTGSLSKASTQANQPS